MTDRSITKKQVTFEGYNDNLLHGTIIRPDDDKSYPGIVFFHGFNTDSREFMDFPDVLAGKGSIVLIFDYSGHGESEGIKTLFTERGHFHDSLSAIEVLSKENIDNITVLGHSLGVYAAFRTLNSQEKISKAVIISPQIKSGDSLNSVKKLLLRITGNLYRIFGDLLRGFYCSVEIDYNRNYQDPDAALRAKRSGFISDRINTRFTEYALKINNLEMAQKTEKPVLFVLSERDRNIPPQRSEKVYEAIRSTEKKLVKLSNSGHSPFDDFDKNLLIERIIEFVN